MDAPHVLISFSLVVWCARCAHKACSATCATHARWIASESNPADAPSQQKWIDARTTHAPCEEELTTKSRITPAQVCFDTAIASRSGRTERYRGKPLSIRRQIRTGSDFSDLRQEPCEFFLLSAFRHVKPHFGQNGEQTLPRSHGPPRKWMELTSSCARQLFPFMGLMAMVTTAFHANLRLFVLAITIGFFSGYRRLSELATPLLDSLWTTAAALSIAALHQKPQNQATKPSNQLVYNKTFHCIATRANVTLLEEEPSSPRHGGASHDAPTDHRNLAQIKTRERWRADCSIQRYKKTTRFFQRVAMLAPRRWHPD